VNSNAFLQLPPGSTGLFLEEAAAHQAAIDVTNRLFRRWGYTMVHTPMVDFFDAHRHMISESDEHRLYRMIGRDGDVLMLRSDITIFLLKHFQNLLVGAQLPVRLSYSDSILRHEDSIQISRNEHYQAGAEFIGGQGTDSDREILLLLAENLETLNVQNAAVHLGSRSLFRLCFPELAHEGSQVENELQQAIRNRDWELLSAIIEAQHRRYSCPARQRSQQIHSRGITVAGHLSSGELIGIFSTILSAGDVDELAALKRLVSAVPGASDEIDYMVNLARELAPYSGSTDYRIDLSEIGSRSYYNALVFQVYIPGLPYPAASGGRYDELIASMGINSGAVGYQIMLSALHAVAPPITHEKTQVLERDGGDFFKRFEKAKTLRSEGNNVCL